MGYYLVGDELQAVMGTPVHYVFQCFRSVLACFPCCSDDSLKWIDPEWTLKISSIARNNPDMHIMNNFKSTFCNRRGGNVFKRGALWVIEFMVCVVWTSMIEWVSPISELFLYMHNWDLRALNVLMIVCSELADFDRMIDLGIFLSAYPDLLGGKVDSPVAKPLAWAVGYMLVMPLTLWWVYKYHAKKPNEAVQIEMERKPSQSQVEQMMHNARRTSSTDQFKRTMGEKANDLRLGLPKAAAHEEQKDSYNGHHEYPIDGSNVSLASSEPPAHPPYTASMQNRLAQQLPPPPEMEVIPPHVPQDMVRNASDSRDSTYCQRQILYTANGSGTRNLNKLLSPSGKEAGSGPEASSIFSDSEDLLARQHRFHVDGNASSSSTSTLMEDLNSPSGLQGAKSASSSDGRSLYRLQQLLGKASSKTLKEDESVSESF